MPHDQPNADPTTGPTPTHGHEIPPTLREIVEHTRSRVAASRETTPERALRDRIAALDAPRPFVSALTDARRHPSIGVIAEIKRRSPSAGAIRPEWGRDDFSPESIARSYDMAGASAISCLTDEKFFAGDPAFIPRIRRQTPLPVLRKDFILDPYQVHETRAMGADAVLLIAECLPEGPMDACLAAAAEHGLGVLLEIHDERHLERALAHIDRAGSDTLLGINNRDLTTMTTDLNHTLRLLARVPDPARVVAESGIRSGADLRTLTDAGVRLALIGEHLMRHEDPGAALAAMLDEHTR